MPPRMTCDFLKRALPAVLSLQLGVVLPARADEQVAPPVVTPPALVADVEAVPPDGSSLPIPEVVLRLTIDEDGAVTEVAVARSGGGPWDEAAAAAAWRAQFRPAARDGVPVAARVLYQARFAPPPSEKSSVEPPVVPAPVESESSDASARAANPGVVGEPSGLQSGPAATTTVLDSTAAGTSSLEAELVASPEELEVSVAGERSLEERLEKSADAVTVVRLDEQRKRSADMGEVLARVPGMVIRRTGGLGSDVRFSLNGLSGDAVPMFVDGVPLWMSGYPRNIADIPINSMHHVEIYRGVVPLRLSADALGGAVNFVTDKHYETGGGASYHVGSFGLYRVNGRGQYRHEPSGFVARLSGFADRTRNDYAIDVEVPDAQGRLHPATVRRFHDAYSAYSLIVETGFVERPWAKRLILKGFQSSSNKELQHNTVMTVPYGEVDYGSTNAGAHLFYDVDVSDVVALEVLATYSHVRTDFRDFGEWVYDWHGQRIRRRRVPGEIESDPTDQSWWQNGVFGRTLVEWTAARGHILALSTSPLVYDITGDERIQLDPDARDPLTAQRFLVRWVSGAGYEWNLLRTKQAVAQGTFRRGTDYALQNTFNVKNYVYYTATEEVLPGGTFRARQRDIVSLGVSDGLRYSFTDYLLLKVSYEYATRLPNPYETFGDGMQVTANLDLVPEVSHNANLGPVLDWKGTPTGDWVGTLNGVLRDTDEMIVLLGNDRFFTYQNVYRATTFGLEGGLSWTSPRRILTLDGTGTYTDQRNASEEGTFADFKGDRIPNRPWLQASWAARLRFESLLVAKDTLEPFYQGRYTHEFFRGWESQGIREFKQKVESQVAHDAGITYTLRQPTFRLASTFEVQNLADAKLYDDFGVQRPGRSFHFKITADL